MFTSPEPMQDETSTQNTVLRKATKSDLVVTGYLLFFIVSPVHLCS